MVGCSGREVCAGSVKRARAVCVWEISCGGSVWGWCEWEGY